MGSRGKVEEKEKWGQQMEKLRTLHLPMDQRRHAKRFIGSGGKNRNLKYHQNRGKLKGGGKSLAQSLNANIARPRFHSYQSEGRGKHSAIFLGEEKRKPHIWAKVGEVERVQPVDFTARPGAGGRKTRADAKPVGAGRGKRGKVYTGKRRMVGFRIRQTLKQQNREGKRYRKKKE